MKTPIIFLEDFGLTDLEVHWYSPVDEELTYSREVNVGYEIAGNKKDPSKLKIKLFINDQNKKEKGAVQSSVCATALGFFVISDQLDIQKDAVKLIHSCLSMLYGALRGALGTICGPFPPDFRYVLPTVDMTEVMKEVEMQRAKDKKSATLTSDSVPSQEKKAPRKQVRSAEKPPSKKVKKASKGTATQSS